VAHCKLPAPLRAHLVPERHSAHEDVEDHARVVARSARVQPMVQLRLPAVLKIRLGVLVILDRVLSQVEAFAVGGTGARAGIALVQAPGEDVQEHAGVRAVHQEGLIDILIDIRPERT
jgi:hypothetical protein